METKVFLAKLEHLYEMLGFLEAYCKSHELSRLMTEHVILAAEEAVVNIISYGYQNESKGRIEISCGESAPPGIKIIIKDRGVPFNPLENAPEIPSNNPFPEKNEGSCGGYGIHILKKIMDGVDYRRIGKENVLTMNKYL